MKSIICTLFEKDYHFGVGVLANSLYAKGFSGEIYAGYKGLLPNWAKNSLLNESLGFKNASTLTIFNDFKINFIPLDTTYHLTNYKPDFMLSLINGPAKDCDALFYYDPDIIQKVSWNFMEQWVDCGVAVAEDVNSPLQELHPRRVYWRNYFKKFNDELFFKNPIYVNGGFIGLKAKEFDFIKVWKDLQEKMAIETGSLSNSIFKNRDKYFDKSKGDFYAFGTTDQDALNASLEKFNGNISYLSKEAMGFDTGFTVIPHALGNPKPWRKKIILDFVLKGSAISPIDSLFWKNTLQPILVYPSYTVSIKLLVIKLVSFLSRFYKNPN